MVRVATHCVQRQLLEEFLWDSLVSSAMGITCVDGLLELWKGEPYLIKHVIKS